MKRGWQVWVLVLAMFAGHSSALFADEPPPSRPLFIPRTVLEGIQETIDFGPEQVLPLPERFTADPPRRVMGFLTSLFGNDAQLLSTHASGRWASLRFSPQIFYGEFHRGIATRDFFRTEAPQDSFSLQRVTYTEGPQAILYSTGTPVGFVHQRSTPASIFRSFRSLSTRVDHDGSYRGTFDINQVLQENQVAVRLIALRQDGPQFRTPSKVRRDSLYGTLSWRINPKNLVRFSAETGKLLNVQPVGSILYDWYTPWVEAGRPMVDEPGSPVGNIPGVEWVAGGNYLVFIEDSDLPVMNWRRMARGAPPQVNDRRESRSSFQPDTLPEGLGIYHSLSGNTNRLERDYRIMSGFWEFVLDSWLSVELAGQYESGGRDQFQGLRDPDHALQVDVNQYLPDGRPNPNVGRPYLETTAQAVHQLHDWSSLQGRALGTLNIHLQDFYEHLGRYELGGLITFWDLTTDSEWHYETNLTPLDGFPEGLNAAANRIRRRQYLDTDLNGKPVFRSDFSPIIQDGVHSAFIPTGNAPQHNEETLFSWMTFTRGFYFDDRLSAFYGVGNDRARVREGIFEQDDRGVWPDARGFEELERYSFDKLRRSYGAVFSWNENWTLYYNRAQSFLPPRSTQRDIFGERIFPQEVDGYETGISLTLPNRNFSANLSTYEIIRYNQPSGALRGLKANWIYSIWDELDPELSRDRIAWVDLQDTRSQGFEFDLVYNPSRNLRVAWNIGHDRRHVYDIMPRFTRYLNVHLPAWESAADVPVNNPYGETVGDLVDLILDDYENERAQIGARLLRNREWQTQLTVNYRFDRQSALRGWSVGLNGRWMEKAIVGFVAKEDGRLDGHRPFYGNDMLNLNTWIGYSRRFDNGMVWNLRVQINNLFNDRDPNLNQAVDDGSGQPVYTQLTTRSPRYLTVSNTLRF